MLLLYADCFMHAKLNDILYFLYGVSRECVLCTKCIDYEQVCSTLLNSESYDVITSMAAMTRAIDRTDNIVVRILNKAYLVICWHW